jgi:predicted Zn finger-like uncharacterized protein
MRVTCPACAATYEVPESRIGAGRRLRCARCQHDWFVEPPAPPALSDTRFARAVERAMAAPPGAPSAPPIAPPPAGPPAMPPAAEGAGVAPTTARARAEAQRADAAAVASLPAAAPPRPPAPRDGSGGLMLAWLASALVLLCFFGALVLYRIDIVAAWPPAERLYVALGLIER